MMYCEKCHVSVVGDRHRCPLCQNQLIDQGGGLFEVFPVIPTIFRQYILLFRILILISVIASVVCVLANLIFWDNRWWSLFVLAGIGCMWLSLAIVVHKRHNMARTILNQAMSISFLVVLWDLGTGWRGWSIDYVIPIVFVTAMIVMAIVAKIMKLHPDEYLIYILQVALFGIIPIIFFLTGILHVILPSLICVAGCVIFIAALFVFRVEALRLELDRRLHL